MNDTEKAKLNRFANDFQMVEAVKKAFELEISKPTKDRDVQSLAARFIAFEIIRDAFKSIENYKDISEVEPNTKINYV